MSSSIIGNVITLTRGDSFSAKVTIIKDDEEYTPVEGDSVRFALKRQKMNACGTEYADQNPLINKTIPNDTLILSLSPGDTKSLGFGTYEYDIEITFADGSVDTFITAAPFRLTKEVH